MAENDFVTFQKQTHHNTTFSYNLSRSVSDWRSHFELYYQPVIFLLGITGNLFCCLVLSLSKLRSSASVYLTALSVADTCYLAGLFVYWLAFLEFNILDTNGICQMVLYVMNASGCFSTWLVVLFTVERFLVVVRPLKKVALCTVKRARRAVLLLAIFPALIYTIVFYMTGIEEGRGCVTLSQFHRLETFFYIFECVVLVLVPLLIIGLMNARICHELMKASRIEATLTQRHKLVPPPATMSDSFQTTPPAKKISPSLQVQLRHTLSGVTLSSSSPVSMRERKLSTSTSLRGGTSCYSNRHHRENRVTRMLIIVSTVFAIMNIPHNIFKLRKMVILLYRDLHYGDLEYCLQYLFINVHYTNYALNFFIYNLTSSSFRKSALDFLLNGLEKCKVTRKWLPKNRTPVPTHSRRGSSCIVDDSTTVCGPQTI